MSPSVPDSDAPGAGHHPPTGEPLVVGSEDEQGVRAWLALVDRKLGTRTYAGAAAVVLALATAIVALVIAVDARDNSAGTDDLSRIENRLGDLSSMADQGQSAQEDVDSLSGRLADLEDEVGGLSSSGDDLDQRLSVVEDDIDDLRGQISDLGGAADDSTGGVSPSGGGDSGDTGGVSPGGD